MNNENHLISEINSAFDVELYLGDDDIVYDNSGYHLECNAVKEYLVGKKYSDLDCEELFVNYEYDSSSIMNFMTVSSFLYYLPGFMILIIKCKKLTGLFVDNILGKLTDINDEKFYLWYLLLSQTQKYVINHFISYVSEQYFDDLSEEQISAIEKAKDSLYPLNN